MTTLERVIRLPHATALVAGTIIGASIFVQPSEISAKVPSLVGVSLVWLVCGVLTLFGALVTAELASSFPRSGGVYVYLREAYSPLLGFLWGWAMFFTMHSGIIALIAMIFARYCGTFTELGPAAIKAVAVAAIVATSVVNYLGARPGSRLQTTLTVVKVLAIVLIIAVGFALGPRQAVESASTAGSETLLGGGSWSDFGLALIAGLFAFGGWHMVTYSSEETVEPRRTIPRALLIGVAIVTLSYLALNAVYFHVLPLETMITSERVAADAADAVLGSGGAALLSSLVVLSTLGALSGIVLAGPRVYFAMARDGLLFRWIAATHPVYRTPHVAIVLQALWASLLVVTDSYRALFTRVIYTEWIFFGLMALGLFALRRRDDVGRHYSTWGYPVVPIVFAAAAFAIVVNQVVAEPVDSLLGLGLIVVGVPVYWIRNRFEENAA